MSSHQSTVGHPNTTNTTPTTNVTTSLHCWPPKHNKYNTNYQCHHTTPRLSTQTQPIQHQIKMSLYHSSLGHPKPTNTALINNVPNHSIVGHPNPANTTATTNVPSTLHCWPPKPNQYNNNYLCPYISPLLATQTQPIQHQLTMSPHHSSVGHPKTTNTTPTKNVTTSFHCRPCNPNQYNTN